jgi:hypothetical protein
MALEVVCLLPDAQMIDDAESLERSLLLGNTRALADEATLALGSDGVRLTLRMWLE